MVLVETAAAAALLVVVALYATFPRWFPLRKRGRVVLYDGKGVNERDDVYHRARTGEFRRPPSVYRGAPSPASIERGDVQLLASFGCPWAYRTLVARALLGLDAAHDGDDERCAPLPHVATESSPLLWLLPALATGGWQLVDVPPTTFAAARRDPTLRGARRVALWRAYAESDEHATCRATVPVLWDASTARVVNNESSDILRFLNDDVAPRRSRLDASQRVQLRPPSLVAEIDRLAPIIYAFNNGVYRAGFAPTRAAYVAACDEVYSALDELEALVVRERRRWLAGDTLSEADVRFFATAVRFDAAYARFFYVDRRPLRAFPALFDQYARLFSMPAIARVTDRSCFSYGVFYALISRWEGRVVGNLARLATLVVDCATGAIRPDAAPWQRTLAAVINAPVHNAIVRNTHATWV